MVKAGFLFVRDPSNVINLRIYAAQSLTAFIYSVYITQAITHKCSKPFMPLFAKAEIRLSFLKLTVLAPQDLSLRCEMTKGRKSPKLRVCYHVRRDLKVAVCSNLAV